MAQAMTRTFAADRLKDDIRERVEDGRLGAGEPIASISDLADRYDIAYGTARKAIRELVDEGVLVSEWGKGTFVAPCRDPEEKNDGLIALAYPLGRYADVLHQLQEDVTQRGGMLTLHNCVEDNKDPEVERKFLESVKSSGFRGVGLFASPVPPLNTDLYADLRAEGIKVALLARPQYDVTEEAVFLPNHRRGGYCVVRELSQRGYEKIVFVGSRDLAVYKEWILEGARRAESQTEATVQAVRQGIEFEAAPSLVDGACVDEWMASLEENTAAVAFRAQFAARLEDARQRMESDVKNDICVVSCFLDPLPGYEHLPRIEYDVPELLEKTVDYLLDDDIPAETLVHQYAQPTFVPGYLDESSE